MTSSATSWRLDLRQRARLEQQALIAQLVRQLRRCGSPASAERPVGLAVHQVDDGEPGRDLRARGALQPMVDLVLQQLGGLVEQIDRDQPVGEPADHLVAAPADRRQLAEIVEQAERVDRRQRIALAGEEQGVEGLGRLVLDAPRHLGVRMRRERGAHDVEGVAIALLLGIEAREQLQRLDLGLVAAPDRGERLELRRSPRCGLRLPSVRRSSISRSRPCAAAGRSQELAAAR